MNKYKKKVLKAVLYPLTWINKCLPKRQRSIVLYSNLGFRDNVRALYEYLVRNHYNEKYRIICSLNDYKKYKGFYNVQFVSNRRGLLYFLRSRYFFYCFGKYPVMPSKDQIVFHLWHGMPLKRIGLMEPANRKEKYDYFSYVLSTSPFFLPVMAEAFGCDKSKVVINGQPRNDALFTLRDVKKELGARSFEKVILWMPTFRVSEKLGVSDTSDQGSGSTLPIVDSPGRMTEVNQFLASNKSCLYVKLHPMQDPLELTCRYTNIRFITDEDMEDSGMLLYEFLSGMDVLITDYSSVYFDYLLLDRPIGFTVNDAEDYSRTRGFTVENPLELMPGHKIADFSDWMGFLRDIMDGNDRYRRERHKINELCNTYKDSDSSKRILEFCGIRR